MKAENKEESDSFIILPPENHDNLNESYDK